MSFTGKAAGLKFRDTDASVHLDAIRGIAAVWVLVGHARFLFIKTSFTNLLVGKSGSAAIPAFQKGEPTLTKHLRFSQLFEGGPILTRMAVIAFFVLSGYLVGGSVLRAMRKGSFSWKGYLVQRLTRLWIVLIPALLLGAVFDASGVYLLHSPLRMYRILELAQTSLFSLKVFLANLFFLQGIVTPCFGSNGALWSLAYEFWYYIFFPLLLIALWASNRTRVRVGAGLLLSLLVVLCGWEIGAYFLIWLMGVGVACLPLQIPPSLRKILTCATGLALFLAMFLELKFPMPIKGFFAADFVIGIAFSLFLWTVLHAQGNGVHRLYRAAAHTLSGMSYTLYLLHTPMLFFISALLFPTGELWKLSPVSLVKLFIVLIVVFAASWLVYSCFERNTARVRKWLMLRVEVPAQLSRV